MAEKKFFVDINLQGSALTNAKIGTNSGIGSTEGAFGYDSASHRLQYFNGTATKDVANLSDISAVTGGLIFQGGYDPTTDTPDITDGTALKGFFWAATAAGTFLGESVQVGDSIVAKVDNAGATIADWLILQGNVVIATDSVDGISRLATQTEANTGTEGGAVVITPATLQGKIDAQITPEISSKLPLAGGTMSGSIDMAENTIDNVSVLKANDFYTNGIASKATGGEVYLQSPVNANGNNIGFLPAPTAGGDAANKTYVDNNTSNKLPLAGGTMSGGLNMGSSNIANVNALLVRVLVDQNEDGSDILLGTNLDGNGYTIVNLPAPTADGDAANKLYVDGAASTAQANAEATASADATTKADAAQAAAEAAANAYTDTGLATKLSLAGGTMEGAIDMDGNSILDANSITASGITSGTIITNNLYDLDAGSITFGSNLDGNNVQTIINLPAPINGGDAANKTYVDTEIAAQSYVANIEVLDWTLESGSYYFDASHGLDTSRLIMMAFDNGTDEYVELSYIRNGAATRVFTNILPTDTMSVSFVKAQ